MANNTLLASDNFASGSLAAGWSAYSSGLKCKVVGTGASAVAEPNALNTVAGQVWTGITWPSDQISEVTLGPGFVFSPNNPIVVLVVRNTGGASPNGYEVNIVGDATQTATLFRYDAGVATQLGSAPSVTAAAGDVWSLAALGDALLLYQNFKLVLWYQDATYTSGSPGFLLFSSTDITDPQVKSWRGYDSVQQDGIWSKQGIIIAPLAGDTSSGAGGVANTAMLHEGNAQILSGTVYKMWFSAGNPGAENNIYYAESSDGISWTRRGATVLANYGSPFIIKNGPTYYMYVQPIGSPGAGDFDAFTSPDGITWTLAQADTFTLGTAGQWDDTIMWYFQPVTIIAGTWYALYSAGHNSATYQLSIGLATSSNGLSWTRHVGNPVLTKANGGSVVNSQAIAKVGALWYMWIFENQPGRQNISVPNLDPGEGTRYSSPDLVNWSFSSHSVHQSEQFEGVNYAFGQCYPNNIFTVGTQTYMYIQSAVSDHETPQIYQITLAIAPATIPQIVTRLESALAQVGVDFFGRANGSLGPNWTTPTGGTALQIASNLVEPTTVGANNQAIYTGATFAADQYSLIELTTLNASSFMTPIVRASTSALTWYEANIGGPSGTGYTHTQIFKSVAGTMTAIGPQVIVTTAGTDIFTLSVTTSSDGFPTLTLFQNGFLVVQVQDTSATPILTGNPGMMLNAGSAVTDSQVSAWGGGNANVIPSYGPTTMGGNAAFLLLGAGQG